MPASGRPARAWGWHRLADEWAARIVAAAALRPGELVLDIGAGTGALTKHLIRAEARVIAVELHPDRAAFLRARFPEATVIHADALHLRLPGRPFRVVASPPYAITADLLALLLAPGSRLTAADLVLQRAVVRKLTTPNAPGPARRARPYRMTAGLTVPRRAFRPPPQVDSAVLVVRRHAQQPTQRPTQQSAQRPTPAPAPTRTPAGRQRRAPLESRPQL